MQGDNLQYIATLWIKLYLCIRSLLQTSASNSDCITSAVGWGNTAEEVVVAWLNPFLSDAKPTDFILLCGLRWNSVHLVFIQRNFTLVVAILRAPPSRWTCAQTAGYIVAQSVTCFQKILCNASRWVAYYSCDPFSCKWTSNSIINISITEIRRRFWSIQEVYFVVSLSKTAVVTDAGCGNYSVMW